MSKHTVLSLLQRQTDYISGEELSRQVGISRAAIWKNIKALREDGYEIAARTNRGYLLTKCPDVLTAEAITPLITTRELGSEIICLDSVDSTNSYLKRLAASGGRHGTIALAEMQTAGRGRLGRHFVSPRGKGIYLSVLLRPQVAPPDSTVLTSFTAVAVCEALMTVAPITPGIKWVNDVTVDDRKICGILTEMAIVSENQTVDYIVIGMGINVSYIPADFPRNVRGRATSLAMLTDKPVSRVELAAQLITALDRMYCASFTRPQEYLDRYRQLCTTVGRDILVVHGDSSVPAHACRVEDDCGLLVRYEDGTEENLRYGEISIRGLESK